MNENHEVVISMSIVTSDQNTIARVMEVLGRAASGLALEGISANLSATRLDPEDSDDQG